MNDSNPILPALLKVIIYFDVFRYPLTKEEIISMIPFTDENQFESDLDSFLQDEIIFEQDGFYGLTNEKKYIKARVEGNLRANKNEFKAYKRAKFISKFPFVRGVFISGSFSKGHMLPDGDVDFFILTKQNKMWLSRTFLILFKKIFLFNSRKFFCLNYFKGADELSIEEQNIFTATELFTLLPVVGDELYDELIKKNSWVNYHYELSKLNKSVLFEIKNSGFKKFVESIFDNKTGDSLDQFFMRMTLKRWKAKFGNMTDEDFELAMKSSRNVSKHHPSNFQKKVLSEYNAKSKSIAKKYVRSTI